MWRITIENPYKNFKEWVKSDAQGGRYISEEKETTVNGLTTTWYEVKYEKLTVPRHGIAFVYHTEDVDFCATIEVLEQHWEKLKPLLLTTMKSFKVVPWRKAAGRSGRRRRPARAARRRRRRWTRRSSRRRSAPRPASSGSSATSRPRRTACRTGGP